MLLAATALLAAQPVADPRLVEAIGWYTGTRGLVDEAKARLLVETTAFEGNVLARMWLSRMYSRGRLGYPRDEGKARAIAEQLVDAVQRQAAAGTVEAVFLMGTAYDEGLGVAEDPSWRSPGSARPPPPGTRWPSTTSATPTPPAGALTADPVLAVEWWLKAAAKGDAVPQLRLGEAYEAGRGVAKNLVEARRWYGEAATRGNADAAAALKRLRRRE